MLLVVGAFATCSPWQVNNHSFHCRQIGHEFHCVGAGERSPQSLIEQKKVGRVPLLKLRIVIGKLQSSYRRIISYSTHILGSLARTLPKAWAHIICLRINFQFSVFIFQFSIFDLWSAMLYV